MSYASATADRERTTIDLTPSPGNTTSLRSRTNLPGTTLGRRLLSDFLLDALTHGQGANSAGSIDFKSRELGLLALYTRSMQKRFRFSEPPRIGVLLHRPIYFPTEPTVGFGIASSCFRASGVSG